VELKELIAEARRRMDDAKGPYLVPDPWHIDAANEAEREACFRARLLFDDTPRAGVTTIAVEADQSRYPIDPSVFWIDAASFKRDAGGRERPLELRGLDWIRDRRGQQWDSSSRPEVLADNGRDELRLWPTPTMPGTLQLAVYRYPLQPMEALDDEPEIGEAHHLALVNWLLYRAYGHKDSELYDERKSERALAEFEETFGKRPHTADVLRKQRERGRITTRYGGL